MAKQNKQPLEIELTYGLWDLQGRTDFPMPFRIRGIQPHLFDKSDYYLFSVGAESVEASNGVYRRTGDLVKVETTKEKPHPELPDAPIYAVPVRILNYALEKRVEGEK